MTELVSGIFGGGKSTTINVPDVKIPEFKPVTLTAPTVSAFTPASVSGGGLTIGPNGVTASGQRTSLVQNLQDALKSYGTNLGTLLPQVQAGSGQLSKAIQNAYAIARQTLANRRQASIGSLKENLAQRRISGSSFASDALARADAEFANAEKDLAAQEATAAGQSFLQELQLTTDILGKQAQANTESFNTGLSELNLEAGVAQQLSTQVNSILAANAQLQAQLAASAKISQAQLNTQGQIAEIGAAGQKAGQQAQVATNQAQLNAGANQGAGELLGTAAELGAIFYLFSDRRMKRDIKRIATLDNGIPLYTFRYKWDDELHVGVMADEVEKVIPEAVHEFAGYKYVDYARIGATHG